MSKKLWHSFKCVNGERKTDYELIKENLLSELSDYKLGLTTLLETLLVTYENDYESFAITYFLHERRP